MNNRIKNFDTGSQLKVSFSNKYRWMKNSWIVLLMIFCSIGAEAKNKEKTNRESKPQAPKITAGCTPATTATDLDINNIRLRVETGGNMWEDRSTTSPRFEVPKNSDQHAMFAGSLWLGGRDVSGQLKVAALLYRADGDDFWPGPLSTTDFEINQATCEAYDRHFATTRAEVDNFRKWYDAGLEDAENGTTKQKDEFPDYVIPQIIFEWPAHGRTEEPFNEDFNLAPFFDRNGDGIYDPNSGDYPGYEFNPEDVCNKTDRKTDIFGDQNLWWVFNDKGNVHTETGASSIGMEIRAQAFSFATNDEVNNMTFMNYELVNRSSFTLTDTYFGVFADADLGGANDDFVGCDVGKGLGYCFNGDNDDADDLGNKGYGANPPAIGIDFFEGPFQDSDDLDNDVGIGENEALNGIGYGDSLVDNERFGMRRFVYFSRQGAQCCNDPSTGTEYYNYLRSIWKDGVKMTYGATGHADGTIEADFMFPGTSDPLNWGTGGVDPGFADPSGWTEVTAGNSPADRRFIQSAGPFTLTPGAVNDITVGVVWARAASGGNLASVDALLKADEKTQALFDNCFRLLGGPDSPELTIQELDKELILFISNATTSNNAGEDYAEKNAFIIPPDSMDDDNDGIMDRLATNQERDDYQTYKFQGYLVYQLKDESVDASALDDVDRARLIYQGDIRDGVSRVLNYPFDDDLGATIPELKVDGANQGITHSLRITEDEFATGDRRLINHKTYYFMAIAYAYNNFKQFDLTNPQGDGQNTQYLPSRKSATGAIKPFSGIPHISSPEAGGTILNSKYGDGVEVTRIEGKGNGGNILHMTQASRDSMLISPWKVKHPVYEAGNGPINVKVVDPLNVKAEDYTVQFLDSTTTNGLDDAYWRIYNTAGDTVYSDRTIAVEYEQLLLDWGISITLEQSEDPGASDNTAMLDAQTIYEDASKEWLLGIADVDGDSSFDWIRAGTGEDDWDQPCTADANDKIDPTSNYENILGGTWAPFRLTSELEFGPMPEFSSSKALMNNALGCSVEGISSVDIVITDDKTKWTRCPVLEAYYDPNNTIGGALRGHLRKSPSVDKDGNPSGWPSDSIASSDENAADYIGAYGMGWFPGYAIDLESGERLNMAFSENSWLAKQNGADMMWNPTDVATEGPFDDVRNGGMHFVYVFRNTDVMEGSPYLAAGSVLLPRIPYQEAYNEPSNRMPAYDAGAFAHASLDGETTGGLYDTTLWNVFSSCMWVGYPMLNPGRQLFETDVTIQLRVRKGYELYAPGDALDITDALEIGKTYFVNAGPIKHDTTVYERGETFVAVSTTMEAVFNTDFEFEKESLNVVSVVANEGLPLYNFTTRGLEAVVNVDSMKENVLSLINVVPNPYYAYSQYETGRLDNRIKIVNLPDQCTITIYTVSGTLVRQYQKDDATITSLDWDLKNFANVPVSSGVYLIHVKADGIGERVLKWFGSLRPVDLESF